MNQVNYSSQRSQDFVAADINKIKIDCVIRDLKRPKIRNVDAFYL